MQRDDLREAKAPSPRDPEGLLTRLLSLNPQRLLEQFRLFSGLSEEEALGRSSLCRTALHWAAAALEELPNLDRWEELVTALCGAEAAYRYALIQGAGEVAGEGGRWQIGDISVQEGDHSRQIEAARRQRDELLDAVRRCLSPSRIPYPVLLSVGAQGDEVAETAETTETQEIQERGGDAVEG